jgi:hypothetical protein
MGELQGHGLASKGRVDRKWRSESRVKADRFALLVVWFGAISACALFWATVFHWLRWLAAAWGP